ncbi:MAG: DUF456 family protein [Myxococcota bacterium]
MTESIGWICAIAGLGLGGFAVLIPGFPGCAVALLGLVAFAAITDFAIVTSDALLLAALLVAVGSASQILGPALGSRALAGSAGAATGAAIGAVLGTLVPVPGFALGCGVLGAILLGWTLSTRGVLAWIRGIVGAAGGCLVSAAIDGATVLSMGAILAIADFLRTV